MRLRLKELRTAQGWSQDVTAAKLGCSKSFLSEVENGKKNMSHPMMEATASLFGLASIVDLYDAGEVSEDLAMIADLLRDMTEAERKTAVRLVATLRGQQ